jgi:hypothetical protein
MRDKAFGAAANAPGWLMRKYLSIKWLRDAGRRLQIFGTFL